MSVTTAPTRVSLRAATADDHDFLLGLYATTRDDLAQLPLEEEQRDALVRMQYHAQDAHYRQTNPHARFDLVEIDGRPGGRLYVDERSDDLRIIDISLLPEHRGTGIGAALVRAVQEEASACGRGVSLHVAIGNPAASLYARLGVRLAEDLGVYRRLEWGAS
jgi:ribosomal protein S18 acetylase RimI-like enzyme